MGDTTALAGLLGQIEDFKTFMGDGAYDSDTVYQQIIEKQPDASDHDIRNQHVDAINERGRMEWQKETRYGLRALEELAMLRYKQSLVRI